MDIAYLFGKSIKSYNEFANLMKEICLQRSTPDCKYYEAMSSAYSLLPVEKSLLFEEYSLYSINDPIEHSNLCIALYNNGYSFFDMLNTSYTLCLLFQLQSPHIPVPMVHAQKCIQVFLYNNYWLESLIVNLMDMAPNLSIGLQDFPKFRNIEYSKKDPQKGIRTHINEFFNQKKVASLNIKEKNRKDSKNRNQYYRARKYVSIYDIPELLFLFQLYDSRDFGEELGIPYLNSIDLPNRIDSMISYAMVIKRLRNLSFPQSSSFDTYDQIIHKYRLAELFDYKRINMLIKYYKKYSSSKMLEYIGDRMGIDRTIIRKAIDTIFSERLTYAFVNSPYLDFFLPFDIHFCHLLKNYSQSATQTQRMKDFERIINDSFYVLKTATNDAQFNVGNFEKFISSGNNNDLNIPNLKRIIIDNLSQNTSSQTNSFYTQYVSDEKNTFIEDLNRFFLFYKGNHSHDENVHNCDNEMLSASFSKAFSDDNSYNQYIKTMIRCIAEMDLSDVSIKRSFQKPPYVKAMKLRSKT